MPDPQTPTPAPDPSQGATQDVGTEKDKREGGQPGAAPENFETRYKESSREAKRLAEEVKQRDESLRQKDQQLQQAAYYLQQQQQQLQQPPKAPESKPARVDEIRALSDAYLSGDVAEIQRLEDLKEERLQQKFLERQRREEVTRQEENASVTVLQQAGLAEMQSNPALAQKVIEKYQRFSSDPTRSLTYKPAKLNVGGYEINPNIMREALLEAKLEMGIHHTNAQEVARLASDSFIEPGLRTPQPIPGSEGQAPKKFDAERHLFDYERSMCGPGKLYKDHEHYWKNMHPELQAERMRKGEPVRWAQLGRGEVTFRFSKS